MNLDPHLIPQTEIHSKWIIDLHVKPETSPPKKGESLYNVGLIF